MKVGFVSLGCSKNLIDTEMMIGVFKNNGFTIVNNPQTADIIVINTCGFIEPAMEEAINTILEMAEYKKTGKCKILVATGCLVERYKEELEKALPEVDIFLKYSDYAEEKGKSAEVFAKVLKKIAENIDVEKPVELSKEEKLDILNGSISSEETNDYDLDTSEIELLNIIRNNNMTVNEFLEAYKENILSAVSGNNKEYTIDSYNDNELFLLDLKNKYDLSDSELEDELNKELSNPDIFAKKVSKIREEYKTLEDEYNKNELLVQENQRVEQYNQFVESMITVAQDTPELHGILLEDEEKNNILSYLAELDENGVSAFYKELNNPQRLYEAAWFLRYGKEAFDTLINAYESEIAKYKKDKPVKAVSRGHKEIKSIYDLH